jgi:hypothetical protein
MRQLRDPVGLAERARELGFVRPERLIDLPDDSALADEEPSGVLASVEALGARPWLDRP